MKKIEESFLITPQTTNKIKLIKLLLVVVFVCHIIGSFWLFISRVSSFYYERSWIDNSRITDLSWQIKYLYACYFSTVTMITVGYGDITPQNPLEVLVNIFTMLISCGVYAYILNKIGSIFEDFSARDDQIKQDLYIINQYMTKKQISKPLQ